MKKKRYYCFETKKWYESGTAAAKELGLQKPWHVYSCANSVAAGYWIPSYKYHFLKEEDIEKFKEVLNENKI